MSLRCQAKNLPCAEKLLPAFQAARDEAGRVRGCARPDGALPALRDRRDSAQQAFEKIIMNSVSPGTPLPTCRPMLKGKLLSLMTPSLYRSRATTSSLGESGTGQCIDAAERSAWRACRPFQGIDASALLRSLCMYSIICSRSP